MDRQTDPSLLRPVLSRDGERRKSDRRRKPKPSPGDRIDAARHAITAAVTAFHDHLATQFRDLSPMPPTTERRSHPHPVPLSQTVYALRLNGEILDIYQTPNAAFEAAGVFRAYRGTWVESRPGRWWSTIGALEVQDWRLK